MSGLALSVALACAVPAQAQGLDAGTTAGIADIVVTAQRREQSLQEVPVAVTALTDDFMQANRIQNVSDLNAVTPNLNIRMAAAGGALPTVVMRGVLSYGVAPGADKQVPIYVDGVYLGNAFGSVFDMADVERVEVLRGPQGTLFGRNATAGAISITTHTPTGEFDLRQELTVGNRDQFRSRTRIDLPAVGPFSASVAYLHNERRGDIRNIAAGTTWDFTAGGYGIQRAATWLGSENTEAVAAAVRFEPEGSNFSVQYKFDWSDFRTTPPGTGIVAFALTPARVGAAAPLLQQLLATQPNPSILTPTGLTRRPDAVNNDFSFPGQVKASGHTITGNWEINNSLTAKAIVAWRKVDVFGAESMLGVGGLVNTVPALGGSLTNPQPFVFTAAVTGADFDQFSGELQFNYESEWVTGTAGLIHYKQTSVQGPRAGVRNIHLFQTYPNRVVPLAPTERPAETEGKSQAAYIQAEFHVTPRLDLVGGFRVTLDKKTAFAFGSTGGVGGGSTSFNYEDTNESYLAGVNFRATDDILIYAKYSHSFMSGGSSFGIDYGPEFVDSWEGGVKADLFDNRVRANLALFHAKYDGLQYTTSGAAVGAPTIGIAVANVGGAKAQGVELEMTVVPVDGLTLTGGLGYTDFKYENLNPLGISLTNNGYHPHYRPKWTGNVAAQYDTQPLFGDAYLSFRVDANYRSHQWLAPNAPVELQDTLSTSNTWIVNGRISLADISVAGHRADLALWGRNLTDDDSMAFVNGYPFTFPANYERARTFGVDLTFNW